MEQKALSSWLKGAIGCLALLGLFIFGFVIPAYGISLVSDNPDYAHCFWPWMILILLVAIPCYAALVVGWKISADIGCDRSFSVENAKRMKLISNLAFGDVMLFFCGNVLLLVFGMSHPGVFLLSLLPDLFGVALAVCAAALSHLIYKSASLQEDADLTI